MISSASGIDFVQIGISLLTVNDFVLIVCALLSCKVLFFGLQEIKQIVSTKKISLKKVNFNNVLFFECLILCRVSNKLTANVWQIGDGADF